MLSRPRGVRNVEEPSPLADFAASPGDAEPVPETGGTRPVISRRTFLENSAMVASLMAIGVAATACDGAVTAAGEPWSDGTLWDDHLGWVD